MDIIVLFSEDWWAKVKSLNFSIFNIKGLNIRGEMPSGRVAVIRALCPLMVDDQCPTRLESCACYVLVNNLLIIWYRIY